MAHRLRCVLLCVLCCLLPVSLTLGGVPGAETSFIELRLSSPDQLEWLLANGFDLAGENPLTGELGLVVTASQLERLEARGFTPSVRDMNLGDRETLAGLQDYTDPVELEAFVDRIVAQHSDIAKKIVLKEANELFEGHRQYVVKITASVDQPNDRPAFLLDAQHHAREVMTPEIARDMIEYLLTRYATDSQVKEWVNNINIYIVPCVNPDGSMHVFTTNAGWRKNRHPNCAVDLNRNYPFLWNGCNGSSGNCNMDTYRGSAAASEPETKGMLAAFEMAHSLFALTYHSYGEYIMYSYGCSDPDEKNALEGIAQALNSRLENDQGRTGSYRVGPIWSTIYEADGGSLDTSYAHQGMYSFVVEVNSNSFQPPFATWRDVTVRRQRTAWQFFLDQTLHGPQIRGKVTDAYTGNPLEAEVSVQEVHFTHGELPRRADSRGLYQWLAESGKSYHFRWSKEGYCPKTRELSVGTSPLVVDIALSYPRKPENLTATAQGANKIQLSWSAAPEVDEYRIYRAKRSGGPYQRLGSVAATETRYLDQTASGGVTYYYVVRSFRECEGRDSAEASASTSGSCSEAPEFAGISSVSNPAQQGCSLELSWTAGHAWCGGLLSYRVYRSTSTPVEPAASNLVAAGVTGTSWTDHSALAGNTVYHYLVHAVDSISGREDSNRRDASGKSTGPYQNATWSDDAGDTGAAKLETTTPWSAQNSGGKTRPKVYATGNYGNNTCAALTTPIIRLDANATLSFHSKYDIETDYDAGVVELASSPDFATWQKLATVNYPDSLANSGNSCAFPTSQNASVFSRTQSQPSYSAQPYQGSLAEWNGKDIKLRFRISSDGGASNQGWWIDDITVANALIPGSCDTVQAPHPKEASPEGSQMSCTRASSGNGVVVDYTPACGALDHAVYWGKSPISGGLSWSGVSCARGTSGRASFDPGSLTAGEMIYFVVVGQDADAEGSYGRDARQGTRHERPEASGLGSSCERPQQLGGTCP